MKNYKATINIDRNLWDEFKQICIAEEITVTAKIVGFISDYIRVKNETDETYNFEKRVRDIATEVFNELIASLPSLNQLEEKSSWDLNLIPNRLKDIKTDIKTDTKTDIETDIKTDIEIDTKTDTNTDIVSSSLQSSDNLNPKNGKILTKTDTKTDIETDIETDTDSKSIKDRDLFSKTDVKTDRPTNGKTDRTTNGKTDRTTDGKTDRTTDNKTLDRRTYGDKYVSSVEGLNKSTVTRYRNGKSNPKDPTFYHRWQVADTRSSWIKLK